ncbi:hypothetical protein CDD82_6766 [Ophiocordyceps australis]|uniref:Major facilitator superfamily (MFS) profile domain-containing protein n=1 Tax=Ophiocordyceps australis TaxID=1399860 RepID=A0A2C5YQL9_9HYPO|nr:hypothetical protein CDD82_6766 [Ophiocordyceps australis]
MDSNDNGIKSASALHGVEKHNVESLEDTESAPAQTGMAPGHRAAVEKRLKRKLDARCTLFVLIYILNYLDRNNIAAARLKGLQSDLHMTDTQYATCLSILYVGYILMQVPSNMVVNRISRPSLYISVSMLLWGLISTMSGVVKSFGAMVAVRFCLGFVEAAFLPGALLILRGFGACGVAVAVLDRGRGDNGDGAGGGVYIAGPAAQCEGVYRGGEAGGAVEDDGGRGRGG